jgi:hypothetical protein
LNILLLLAADLEEMHLAAVVLEEEVVLEDSSQVRFLFQVPPHIQLQLVPEEHEVILVATAALAHSLLYHQQEVVEVLVEEQIMEEAAEVEEVDQIGIVVQQAMVVEAQVGKEIMEVTVWDVDTIMLQEEVAVLAQ